MPQDPQNPDEKPNADEQATRPLPTADNGGADGADATGGAGAATAAASPPDDTAGRAWSTVNAEDAELDATRVMPAAAAYPPTESTVPIAPYVPIAEASALPPGGTPPTPPLETDKRRSPLPWIIGGIVALIIIGIIIAMAVAANTEVEPSTSTSPSPSTSTSPSPSVTTEPTEEPTVEPTEEPTIPPIEEPTVPPTAEPVPPTSPAPSPTDTAGPIAPTTTE